ncbi:hypothetical protein ACJJTC_006120 [Scirpophaga incertulas]
MSAGYFLPVAAILYYTTGIISFGLLRGRDPVDSAMFPLEFKATGGLELVENHVRILYAVYTEGVALLLACAVAALRRHSLNTISDLSERYRLFTVVKWCSK